MRIYAPEDEEKLRILSRAAVWLRSKLITEPQFRAIESAAAPGFRRTTLMLRILLFIFTSITIAASVAFVAWFLGLNRGGTAAWCGFAAILSYLAADILAGRYRFHRHGAEEAFAAGALVLVMISAGYFIEQAGLNGKALTGVMEVTAFAGAFALFARFGRLYMALAGVLALSCFPFTVFPAAAAQRSFLAAMLASGLFAFRIAERSEPMAFRREEYSVLFSSLFFGLCLAVNLRLEGLASFRHIRVLPAGAGVSPLFYWTSYMLTFLVPAAGLAFGIRGRKRALIIASVIGVILALATNKDYLGLKHYAWDPAVLGILLIAVSAALGRWLKGNRGGYTAEGPMIDGGHGLEAAALAAGSAGVSQAPAGEGVRFGGGESGGGGSSRGF